VIGSNTPIPIFIADLLETSECGKRRNRRSSREKGADAPFWFVCDAYAVTTTIAAFTTSGYRGKRGPRGAG
jgi:hypothetical protein